MPWILSVTLIIAAITLLADLYLGWRLSAQMKYLHALSSGILSRLVIVLFASIFIYPLGGLLQYLFTGDFHLYGSTPVIIYWFWFGLVFSVNLLSWFLAFDVIRLALSRGLSFRPSWFDTAFSWLMLVAALSMAGYTGWKMHADTTDMNTDKIMWKTKEVPAALHGLKIVHISDVQADEFTGESKMQRYINQINAQRPDLVIFTGDLVTMGPKYIDLGAHMLGQIRARHGVYAVGGDHDYWSGLDRVYQALRKNGVKILHNEQAVIDIFGGKLLLTGILNVYSENIDPQKLQQLLHRSDTTEADLKFLVTHQINNRIVEQLQQHNYHWALAGHTHGGQVEFSIFGQRFSAPRTETEYISGVYKSDSLSINVNNGLGFTLAPIRYNAPANVSLIRLEQKVD